ncbi:Hypothetical protein SCF082_LOCUS44275 [Durusdinium trenchii]
MGRWFLLGAFAARAAIVPSTETCEALSNCSPSQCQSVSNSPCSFTDPNIDWPELIGSVSCKSCTQSSDARCSVSGMQEVFNTDATSAVKAMYCNDNYLVVWSAGKPPTDDTLASIPRPPGGGGGGGYENECVTRSTIEQSQTYKIPLTSPPDEAYEWTPNPPAGASGVGKNGVPFYPGLDNGGHWVWDVCEADKCNAHVGRGGDYHYHGDPIGSACVYTADSYTNNDPHTVKIGYALDGYLVYGRYTASNQPGIDVDLDLCGGHSHDSYGYHYHPSVETRSGSSQLVSGDYTAYYLGPKKCFKGQVSSISNFYADASKPYTQGGMDVGQPNYDNTLKQYDVSSRSDYEDLKPCCSMSNSWAASGISFDTTGNTGKDGTTGTGTTGGGTGGTTLGSCSGTDDKGKTCPPDYTADKPCPPGCTTIPAGSTTSGANSGATTTATTASSGSYEYTTANALSYMCGSLDTTGREITCGQGEYPAGNNEGTDASISCSSGTIECFVFASVGLVGGSCSGDPFAEDPSGKWAYMPESVASACVGQASCTVVVGDGTLNSEAVSPSTAGYTRSKFKALAVCSTGASTTGASSTETSSTASSTSMDPVPDGSTSSSHPAVSSSAAPVPVSSLAWRPFLKLMLLQGLIALIS